MFQKVFAERVCSMCQKCRGAVAQCTKKFSWNTCAPCAKQMSGSSCSRCQKFSQNMCAPCVNKCQGAAAQCVKCFRRFQVSKVVADYRRQKFSQLYKLDCFHRLSRREKQNVGSVDSSAVHRLSYIRLSEGWALECRSDRALCDFCNVALQAVLLAQAI